MDDPEDTALTVAGEAPASTTSVLRQWHRRYAEWMVSQPILPTKQEKQAKATIFSGRRQTFTHILRLEKDPTYRQLLSGMMADAVAESRAVARTHAADVIRGHFEMAEAARSAGDYDKFAKYSQPILDRIWPKVEERAQVQTQVNISFGQTGFAARQQEVPDAEYEIVVVEPAPQP